MDSTERFTAIFREHRVKVTAYARRRTGAEVAQDVVSDTFLAAWRHIDSLPADPLPWLYRAAAFAIANRHRRAARELRLSERATDAPAPRESDVADTVGTASTWHAALAALSDREREFLLLAAWEQLKPAQAAAALDCSVTAYRVRLHRARRRLSELVGTGSTLVAGRRAPVALAKAADEPRPAAETGAAPSDGPILSLNVRLKEV